MMWDHCLTPDNAAPSSSVMQSIPEPLDSPYHDATPSGDLLRAPETTPPQGVHENVSPPLISFMASLKDAVQHKDRNYCEDVIKTIAYMIYKTIRDIHRIRKHELSVDMQKERKTLISIIEKLKPNVAYAHNTIFRKYYSPSLIPIILYHGFFSLLGSGSEQVTERMFNYIYYVIYEADFEFKNYLAAKLSGNSQQGSEYDYISNMFSSMPCEIKIFFNIAVPLQSKFSSAPLQMNPSEMPLAKKQTKPLAFDCNTSNTERGSAQGDNLVGESSLARESSHTITANRFDSNQTTICQEPTFGNNYVCETNNQDPSIGERPLSPSANELTLPEYLNSMDLVTHTKNQHNFNAPELYENPTVNSLQPTKPNDTHPSLAISNYGGFYDRRRFIPPPPYQNPPNSQSNFNKSSADVSNCTMTHLEQFNSKIPQSSQSTLQGLRCKDYNIKWLLSQRPIVKNHEQICATSSPETAEPDRALQIVPEQVDANCSSEYAEYVPTPAVMRSAVNGESTSFNDTRRRYKICAYCGAVARIGCKLCRQTYYCSRECQVNDWQRCHKEYCARTNEDSR